MSFLFVFAFKRLFGFVSKATVKDELFPYLMYYTTKTGHDIKKLGNLKKLCFYIDFRIVHMFSKSTSMIDRNLIYGYSIASIIVVSLYLSSNSGLYRAENVFVNSRIYSTPLFGKERFSIIFCSLEYIIVADKSRNVFIINSGRNEVISLSSSGRYKENILLKYLASRFYER